MASLPGKHGQRREVHRGSFDHYDIRVYIDNLFLEGSLRPVPVASTEGMPAWVLAGVLFDKQAEERRRIKWLLEKIRQDLPEETASHRTGSAWPFCGRN